MKNLFIYILYFSILYVAVSCNPEDSSFQILDDNLNSEIPLFIDSATKSSMYKGKFINLNISHDVEQDIYKIALVNSRMFFCENYRGKIIISDIELNLFTDFYHDNPLVTFEESPPCKINENSFIGISESFMKEYSFDRKKMEFSIVEKQLPAGATSD